MLRTPRGSTGDQRFVPPPAEASARTPHYGEVRAGDEGGSMPVARPGLLAGWSSPTLAGDLDWCPAASPPFDVGGRVMRSKVVSKRPTPTLGGRAGFRITGRPQEDDIRHCGCRSIVPDGAAGTGGTDGRFTAHRAVWPAGVSPGTRPSNEVRRQHRSGCGWPGSSRRTTCRTGAKGTRVPRARFGNSSSGASP